jgi:hypothetical protein
MEIPRDNYTESGKSTSECRTRYCDDEGEKQGKERLSHRKEIVTMDRTTKTIEIYESDKAPIRSFCRENGCHMKHLVGYFIRSGIQSYIAKFPELIEQRETSRHAEQEAGEMI